MKPLHAVCVLAAAWLPHLSSAFAVPFAFEDFEDVDAPFHWPPTNGVWQVGTPTSGPGAAHAGTSCLATVLGGDYPDNQASRAESRPFDVPAIEQNPRLRFWQWIRFSNGSAGSGIGADFGRVQISDDNGSTWKTLGTVNSDGGGVWSPAGYDLRE